ncbi:c-type cytochrome [Pseudaminobacter sp. 19-2017]|uniref:C-type cytochrome n=1 Tax=Pseudaminobacter soli (ex Zhang et al. 2022) TaxID=2831468 RepID=A0A942DZ60_9HYPH|nr:cytochrome c [Pseudaminobacter soli]MBS3650699.1 c-type cytochrome [Pseudaminobacter soli]
MQGTVRTLIASIVAVGTSPVSAAQAQDVRQGRELAREVCASCHEIRPGQSRSPIATAPSFQRIAETPGMTAAALNVWLTVHEHPTMPMIKLSRDEVRNVSAYILSLNR